MTRQMNVLLVEDNEVDAKVFRRALRRVDDTACVVHAKDGVEALEVLDLDGGKRGIASPYLIMLDINMPRMGGHEFLEELVCREHAAHNFVFVFTTSQSPFDIERAYGSGANAYIVKPTSAASLVIALESLRQFWNLCEPPPQMT
jgi:CheY-like chemotaxis protein